MKDKDIESFLRGSKPKVKDNPAFLLEVQQKMREVDGIKKEVDRQRSFGRIAMVSALCLGLLAGAFAMLLLYLYPIDNEIIGNGIIEKIRIFIEPWKHYLMLPVAGCALALGILAGVRRYNPMDI